MQNPHEQQQRHLIERIVTSVDQLNEVVTSINGELANLERHRATVQFVHHMWQGYNQKLTICFNTIGTVPPS